MTMDTIIGVDLAKNVFQLHGASDSGEVKFRKKLTREQFRRFMVDHPPAIVAMEACGSAHYWAREMEKLGHAVKLIAPRYVKPFVKRQKNDAADAEAIVIAAQRPEMRFVVLKSEDQQARAVLFRARERLVHQRTDLVNSLRSVLYEYGHVVPQGIKHLPRIAEIRGRRIGRVRSPRRSISTGWPHAVESVATSSWNPWPHVHGIDGHMRVDYSDIRQLLIMGAMSRLNWAGRRGIAEGSWLARICTRKPRMVVAIALANKMARAIWAMLTKQQDYRDPTMGIAA